jgi:hypothetical protein
MTTLDCRGKWNLKMNYGGSEVSTCICVQQLAVWSHTYRPLFIQEFQYFKSKMY